MSPRPVAGDNINDITILEQQNPSPWNREQLKDEIMTAGGFSLAVENRAGEVAAYILLRRVCDEAEILKFAVAGKYRRQGLGQRLLGHAMLNLAQTGIKKIFLEVRATNIAAIKLYEKLTFFPIGCRRDYYNNPVEDALRMVAWLKKPN